MLDYRAELSLEAFQAIKVDPEYPIDDLWVALIDGNKKFNLEVSLDQLTPGQRRFWVLAVFDGQVCNGGITQFFWNCPERILPVADALREIGEHDLLEQYERAVESLSVNQVDWLKLREACYSNPQGYDWEPFRQSYGLLELSWFDDMYFDRRGYDTNGNWVVLEEGLGKPFLRRLAAYVKSHPEDFISGQQT